MKKIILVSHGDLATGLKSTLEMIAGENESVYALSMAPDENPDQIADRFKKIFEEGNNMEDSYLIASDLPGGSVNTAMMKYLTYDNVYIVSGVNLVFLLEYIFSVEQDVSEAITQSVSKARESLMQIELTKNYNDDEDIWE